MLEEMITASQITASVSNIRFDRSIMAFNFQPSLGIVAKNVERLGIDIRSMREPLTRSVRQVMVPSIRKNFDSGGRPAWEPLAPSTIARRNFSAWPILVRKGKLRRGVTTISVWTITQTAATIKDLPDRIWYGKVHQAGYSGGNNARDWFSAYKEAARRQLGPRATEKDVNNFAFKLFDRDQAKRGPTPVQISDIPARPFALFQDEDLEDIQEVFADWLEERARRVGRFT
jgi:phage gpG-like protein